MHTSHQQRDGFADLSSGPYRQVRVCASYPVDLEGVASAGGERRVPLPHDLLGCHTWTKPKLGQDTLKSLVDRNVVHLESRESRDNR